MDVASSGGDPINKSLMTCNGILVRLDQFLQPLPAAFGAIEVDYLKPVRPRVNERLPTLRIERDALDVATAPLVDDRHPVSFDLVRIEPRAIVLRAIGAAPNGVITTLNTAPDSSLGLAMSRHTAETDCVAGVVRLELRNA